MLESKDVSYHLRTHSAQAPENTLVYLADTTGELATLIQCADLALGGKTLPPNRGGQNPIEPISLGVPLVLGPNYQNFHQTCGDLLVHNALIAAKSADETKSCLIELAKSPEKRTVLRPVLWSGFILRVHLLSKLYKRSAVLSSSSSSLSFR